MCNALRMGSKARVEFVGVKIALSLLGSGMNLFRSTDSRSIESGQRS
jgi:hypothetical protein